MTEDDFNQLVDFVSTTGLKPPAVLFRHGHADWRSRVSLAKFLCHPAYGRIDESIALLASACDAAVQMPEEIEQKAWAMKNLSFLLRKYKRSFSPALRCIDAAIQLAESTDHRYQTILRGELWAERWIILNQLQQLPTALSEADQKIADFHALGGKNNSYLYNAYRFKAQAAGAQGNVPEFLRLMKKALAVIRLNEHEKKALAVPLSAKHNNIRLLLDGIDLATPKKISWMI